MMIGVMSINNSPVDLLEVVLVGMLLVHSLLLLVVEDAVLD